MVTRAEYTAETGTLHEDIREILTEMRLRFDAGDKKFDLLHEEMNARFEANDKRFDDMNKRFDQMVRLTGLGITALALLITVFNFI